MASPYVLEYDLTWLAVWGVWWGQGLVEKRHRWDRGLLVLLWTGPALTHEMTHWNWTLPIAQFSLMTAFWWTWRGTRKTPSFIND